MVNPNVIKGVHELLKEHGSEQRPGESFGDFVARALNISASQAEVLLEALSNGSTLEQASAKAEIDSTLIDTSLLTRLARVIGKTLGEMSHGI